MIGWLLDTNVIAEVISPKGAARVNTWADAADETTLHLSMRHQRDRPPRYRTAAPVIDTLLAATALEHELYLVTRTIRDGRNSGVTIFNPWTDDPGNFSVFTQRRRRRPT